MAIDDSKNYEIVKISIWIENWGILDTKNALSWMILEVKTLLDHLSERGGKWRRDSLSCFLTLKKEVSPITTGRIFV